MDEKTLQGFMQHMKQEFPVPLNNHFTYDLVENLVRYAYKHFRVEDRGGMLWFLYDILPEVTIDELGKYLPDFI